MIQAHPHFRKPSANGPQLAPSTRATVCNRTARGERFAEPSEDRVALAVGRHFNQSVLPQPQATATEPPRLQNRALADQPAVQKMVSRTYRSSDHSARVQQSDHSARVQPSGHSARVQPSGHSARVQQSDHSARVQPLFQPDKKHAQRKQRQKQHKQQLVTKTAQPKLPMKLQPPPTTEGQSPPPRGGQSPPHRGGKSAAQVEAQLPVVKPTATYVDQQPALRSWFAMLTQYVDSDRATRMSRAERSELGFEGCANMGYGEVLSHCASVTLSDLSLHTHNHTRTYSLSLVLVVMMRSKEFETSRSVLMLIL